MLHLVPQLLKYGEKIGGNRIEDDPFGRGFLERLAKTPEQELRLVKIGSALSQTHRRASRFGYVCMG